MGKEYFGHLMGPYLQLCHFLVGTISRSPSKAVKSTLSPYIFKLSFLHELKPKCAIRHSLNLLHLPFM